MDDAEPLNDAQAETVLLALGNVLKWEPVEPFDKQRFSEGYEGRFGRVAYRVWKVADVDRTDKPFFAAQDAPPFHCCETGFAWAEFAEAACERHYATGKWE